MTDTCGCCEGLESLTPLPTANRPGLDRLKYRIGTHATFLETMKARLSSHRSEASEASISSPLKALKTRDGSDPTIALLDAWALVADVLTFYQERIANEGYLRTATERRSVLELGRLVGYTLRPGVAATVYPAFMMEPGYNKEGEVPQGTRVQSIPGPGEMPQYFETSERIKAREVWNELKPRMSQPQKITLDNVDSETKVAASISADTLYFQGTSTNLKVNDLLLLVDTNEQKIVRRVRAIQPDFTANRTKATLQEPATQTATIAQAEERISTLSVSVGEGSTVPPSKEVCAFEKLAPLIKLLTKEPSSPPPNRQQLDRSPQQTFRCQSDMPASLLGALQPKISTALYQAWANVPVTEPATVTVYALRVKAAPFGHNAPLRPIRYDEDRRMVIYGEWTVSNPQNQATAPIAQFTATPREGPAPLTVQLTNQSTGDITQHRWNFGDESTSTAQQPSSHTFQNPGSYTITLEVSGVDERSTQYTTPITAYAPPVARFNASRTSGQSPVDVTFRDQSEGNITEYLWEFGGGRTSNVPTPPQQRFTAGSGGATYVVRLTVRGPGGSDSFQTTITVSPPGPA